MKKKILSVLLCMAMMSSALTGCGGDDKKEASNKGSKDGNYEEFITVDVFYAFALLSGYTKRMVCESCKGQIQHGVEYYCAKCSRRR